MKLYVPEIGDKLKLTKDWSFELHWEHRNSDLIKHLFNDEFTWKSNVIEQNYPKQANLPAGTVLQVDRVYIRQGASEYSSLSFYAMLGKNAKGSFGKPKSPRFWVTLQDCNKIEFKLEKAEPKIKLECDTRLVKSGDYCGRSTSRSIDCKMFTRNYASEGHFLQVVKAAKSVPVLKVKVESLIRWEKMTGVSSDAEAVYHGYFEDVKFHLHTMQGDKVYECRSINSLKRKAKEWVAKNMPC